MVSKHAMLLPKMQKKVWVNGMEKPLFRYQATDLIDCQDG
jgi:hypothetical protein